MNSKKWNKIVDSNDSKIYHLYEWGTLLNEVHGHKLIYLEEDKGGFPLAYVKSYIFGNRLISLPFADYGGPCTTDEKTGDKLVAKAESAAKELNVDFIEIRAPSKQHFKILENHGFIKRNDYVTFILHLDKERDELWKNLEKENRTAVRKAKKNNIKITEVKNKSDLKIFYTLYLKTMKKLGSPPQSYKFFEMVWDLFYPQNLKILFAIYDNKCIASALFFKHKDTIHYSYGCSLREYAKFRPNNLLFWTLIEWGCENGFKYLDFGRTRENSGVWLFKKKWGGELVTMPYFYKFYKKELKERQEIEYEKVSDLWGKYMPEFVANKIGPWIIKQIG